jgi:hypothetical protein
MTRNGHGCTRSYPDLRYYTGICQKVGADIKVPLSLCSIKHRAINTHGVKVLNREVRSASHSVRFVLGKSPRQLLNGKKGGPHNRSGRFKEHLCPSRESRCRPASDLVPNNCLKWGGIQVCREEKRENTDTHIQDSRLLGWNEVVFIETDMNHENTHLEQQAPGLRCEPGTLADESVLADWDYCSEDPLSTVADCSHRSGD